MKQEITKEILRQSNEIIWEIIASVKTIFFQFFRNANIVDNMIRMMEDYTNQLENLVDERTMQLAEEKAKTDELLYKMLPK